MEIKRGIPVSPGVVIGPALVLDTEGFHIPERFISEEHQSSEIVRLHRAIKGAAQDARDTQKTVNDKLGGQYGKIFEAHALLIEDPNLRHEIEQLIRQRGLANVWAETMTSLEALLAIDPLVVLNSDGVFKNHLSEQGFALLRARIQLREITAILQK